MKYGKTIGKGIYSNALKEFLKNSYSMNQKETINGFIVMIVFQVKEHKFITILHLMRLMLFIDERRDYKTL